jgi:hypothetical protein
VTGDAEKGKGGEQRVRCREVEVGVRFIGLGRQWGGGEPASGGGVLLIDFEGVKGGRGDGTALIQPEVGADVSRRREPMERRKWAESQGDCSINSFFFLNFKQDFRFKNQRFEILLNRI